MHKIRGKFTEGIVWNTYEFDIEYYPLPTDKHYSEEAYLAFEKNSTEKHEYKQGKISVVPVDSHKHDAIVSNVSETLKSILKTKELNYEVLDDNTKIYIDSADAYVYSDGFVVCGEMKYHRDEQDGIINPALIIEVLSENSVNYDRGAKFRKYCALPSFKEYVLITQNEPVVEVLIRDIDCWKMTTTIGLDKSVRLNSLDIEIPLSLIYKNIYNLPASSLNKNFKHALKYYPTWLHLLQALLHFAFIILHFQNI